MNGGNGAPVVGGGGEVVEELQGDVEKLGVEAIVVEEGRREVSHGEQKATAGGDRRQSSGSQCGALGDQLGGRRASRSREESTGGVVVVREGSELAAHGEQKVAAELELAGAVEDEAWMREGEIGRAVEHQWVTTVLWEYWIGAERRHQRLSTVARRGGGGPVRGLSSGKEMLGKRRAATGKQDHRAAVRCVLRPGAGLRCKQELATAARAWRPADSSGIRGARVRGQQGRGTGPGQEENDAWTSSQQEVAWWRWQSGGQGRSSAGGRRGNKAEEHVLEEEEERGGVQGTCLEISRISGTS
jgi:hypothetical protein